MGCAKEIPENVKKEDLILMGNCIPKQFRDKGIFVEGCPPWEMHPAWPIIERRWVDNILGWERNYAQEIDVFLEYDKKNREKIKS